MPGPSAWGRGYRFSVAGGAEDALAPAPVRRVVDQPQWWGVLAVLLALIAVTAVIATVPSAPRRAPHRGAGAAGSTPGPVAGGHGYAGRLAYPGDPTQSFTQGGAAGAEEATVTWSVPAALRLTVACDGRPRTVTGRARLRLSVPAGAGDCRVTLSEVDRHALVPYRLRIDRASP